MHLVDASVVYSLASPLFCYLVPYRYLLGESLTRWVCAGIINSHTSCSPDPTEGRALKYTESKNPQAAAWFYYWCTRQHPLYYFSPFTYSFILSFVHSFNYLFYFLWRVGKYQSPFSAKLQRQTKVPNIIDHQRWQSLDPEIWNWKWFPY